MTIIQLIISLVILGTLYVRMIRREVPKPIGKMQAVVPVLLGVLSILVSFLIMIGIGLLALAVGYSTCNIANPVLKALVGAFLGAGLAEELAKLLMILLSFRLFRPKNLYESILIGAAVGTGFTVHEEVLYAGSLAGIGRMVTVAMHMVYGVIMTYRLGMARYKKLRGESGVNKDRVLALVFPVLLHTVYDACTVFNPAIDALEGDDVLQLASIIIGAVALLVGTAWQVLVLVQLKKHAANYSAMAMIPYGGEESEALSAEQR